MAAATRIIARLHKRKMVKIVHGTPPRSQNQQQQQRLMNQSLHPTSRSLRKVIQMTLYSNVELEVKKKDEEEVKEKEAAAVREKEGQSVSELLDVKERPLVMEVSGFSLLMEVSHFLTSKKIPENSSSLLCSEMAVLHNCSNWLLYSFW